MDKEKFRAIIFSLGFKPDECWVWPRKLTDKGYTKVYFEGKQIFTHRASYMTFVGDIPGGLPLDHLCRNRPCMNPSHLEPVTLRENILRGECNAAKNLRKTHCIRGHEFYFDSKLGHRRCKVCAKERYVARHVAKPVPIRTQCNRGHPYRGDERIENGGRVCRECSRIKTANYRNRIKV